MVIHLITRLALGGAQQQVIQITSSLTKNNKENHKQKKLVSNCFNTKGLIKVIFNSY